MLNAKLSWYPKTLGMSVMVRVVVTQSQCARRKCLRFGPDLNLEPWKLFAPVVQVWRLVF
jgi:hypothetical protein